MATLGKYYDELDAILLGEPEIQFNASRIQDLFKKIEKEKQHLVSREYPLLQNPKFKVTRLTKLYEGIYNSEDIASKVYKLYGGQTDGVGSNVSSPMQSHLDATVYKLTPVQKLLRNMMSPDTPYRGLLVVHGTGVGKTCTAITIAENLKPYVKANEQKIYILRDREFRRQMFNVNMLAAGTPGYQCTGETYLNELIQANPRAQEFVAGCMQGSREACTKVEKMVKRQIQRYYDFSSPEVWARGVRDLLDSRTRHLTDPVEKQAKQVKLIRSTFNNSVMIIDEVHNLRNVGSDTSGGEDEEKYKFVIEILVKVLLYSQNMRLVLLTATPMYDKPTDIVPLLNFLLINDKRPQLTEKELFTADLDIKNKDHFLKVIRGYVSYIRGNDPLDFPIRLDADANLAPKDLVDLDKYPRLDIFGKKVTHPIKHLTLVNCPMSASHQQVLLGQLGSADPEMPNDLTSDDAQFSVAYTKELQISNFIYATLDEANGNTDMCYGNRGLSQVAQKSGQTYTFKEDDYAFRFSRDLDTYGPKLHACLRSILESQGPVFVYTRFTPSGVIPMAFALEMAGFTRYKDEPELLSNPHKPKGDTRGRYIIYTGDPMLSRGAQDYFGLDKRMVKEDVKVVIASEVGAEGLNLYGFREVHILEPWHNLNLNEQTIGRVIRYRSHSHIPNPAERNVTVYMYATTLTGKFKERESTDLHIYAIAELKAFKSGAVEYLLKSGAFDCSFTRPLNYRPRDLYKKPVMIITSRGRVIQHSLFDKPYSRDTLYMPNSNYSCELEEDKAPLEISPSLRMYEIEIRELMESVIAILRENFNLLEPDMLKLITMIFKREIPDTLKQAVYQYLLDYMDKTDVVILDKYGRSARVVRVAVGTVGSKILRLIPLSYFDSDQPQVVQTLASLGATDMGKLPASTRPVDKVNLLPYISALRKDKKRLISREELSYDTILERIESVMSSVNDVANESGFSTHIDADLCRDALYKAIFDRLLFIEKKHVLETLLLKLKNGPRTVGLTPLEKTLFRVCRYNIVHQDEIYKGIDTAQFAKELPTPDDIYGFILAEFNKLYLYKYNPDAKDAVNQPFIEDKTKRSVLLAGRKQLMKNQVTNKLFGFLMYTKNTTLPPIFKITDYITRGEKKSVKGVACTSKQVTDINNYIKILDPEKNYVSSRLVKNKKLVCSDLEMLFRIKNTGPSWTPGMTFYFYGPEEYMIWLQ